MTITEYDHVETERDGSVLIVRLANEEARNALTSEMRFSLRTVVREIEDDHTIRAVYLTGKGKSFCAGGDLRMLTEAKEPWAVHRRFQHSATLFPPLMGLNRPVVAGVRGHAVGGGMALALHADALIAGDSAQFMAGFFRLGVVPDCLMLHILPRLVGLARARNFLFSGATWDADQAVDVGIAARAVADDEVDTVGLELAHQLASGPAQVMGLAKQLLLKSFETSMPDMMMYEDLAQALAMSSAEFGEGLDALIERRPADFVAAAENDPTGNGLPPSIER